MAESAGIVVILDCTKLGRVSSKELDQSMETIQRILSRRSGHSVAFVTAPVCTSERVGNTLKNEARISREV